MKIRTCTLPINPLFLNVNYIFVEKLSIVFPSTRESFALPATKKVFLFLFL